jgi:hypothetical protein
MKNNDSLSGDISMQGIVRTEMKSNDDLSDDVGMPLLRPHHAISIFDPSSSNSSMRLRENRSAFFISIALSREEPASISEVKGQRGSRPANSA